MNYPRLSSDLNMLKAKEPNILTCKSGGDDRNGAERYIDSKIMVQEQPAVIGGCVPPILWVQFGLPPKGALKNRRYSHLALIKGEELYHCAMEGLYNMQGWSFSEDLGGTTERDLTIMGDDGFSQRQFTCEISTGESAKKILYKMVKSFKKKCDTQFAYQQANKEDFIRDIMKGVPEGDNDYMVIAVFFNGLRRLVDPTDIWGKDDFDSVNKRLGSIFGYKFVNRYIDQHVKQDSQLCSAHRYSDIKSKKLLPEYKESESNLRHSKKDSSQLKTHHSKSNSVSNEMSDTRNRNNSVSRNFKDGHNNTNHSRHLLECIPENDVFVSNAFKAVHGDKCNGSTTEYICEQAVKHDESAKIVIVCNEPVPRERKAMECVDVFDNVEKNSSAPLKRGNNAVSGALTKEVKGAPHVSEEGQKSMYKNANDSVSTMKGGAVSYAQGFKKDMFNSQDIEVDPERLAETTHSLPKDIQSPSKDIQRFNDAKDARYIASHSACSSHKEKENHSSDSKVQGAIEVSSYSKKLKEACEYLKYKDDSEDISQKKTVVEDGQDHSLQNVKKSRRKRTNLLPKSSIGSSANVEPLRKCDYEGKSSDSKCIEDGYEGQKFSLKDNMSFTEDMEFSSWCNEYKFQRLRVVLRDPDQKMKIFHLYLMIFMVMQGLFQRDMRNLYMQVVDSEMMFHPN